MKRPSSVCLVLLVLCAASDSSAQTPSVLDLFRYDPVRYFTGSASQKWVGNVSFMLTDYSDTLKLAVDSSGQALVISRVLVRTSDTTVVSRGAGLVTPEPGGETYLVRWTERNYAEATGRMHWGDNQWEISFDGEWKQWSINVRRASDSSFIAGLARAVGSFPPVELAEMTYAEVRGGK